MTEVSMGQTRNTQIGGGREGLHEDLHSQRGTISGSRYKRLGDSYSNCHDHFLIEIFYAKL